MTSVLAAGLAWRWGYGTVAAAQGLLAAAFVLTAGSWSTRPSPDPAAPADAAVASSPADQGVPAGPGVTAGRAVPAGQGVPADQGVPAGAAEPVGAAVIPLVPVRKRATLALPAVWFGALAFAIYTAIEVAAGLWAYTLLTQGRQMGPSAAGICVAAYWGSLFAGRLILGVLAERVGSGRVLLVSLGGMIFGAVLVALPAPAWVAVVGLMLVGLAAAPVFPLLTLTTAERVGQQHADRAIGVQIGAAGLGGAALPAAIGVLLSRVDVEVLGPSLVTLSVALLALYLTATGRPPPATGGPAR